LHASGYNQDIVIISSNNYTSFVIDSENNVGVGVSNPTEKLEVDGTVKAQYFTGSGQYLLNVNLSDKNTSELAEGSNLYFTEQRVYDILYGENYMSSNSFIPFISHIYSNVVNDLDNASDEADMTNESKSLQTDSNF
jgi:hypothetical protein